MTERKPSLKRALKGINSKNLETRIKSAVFLINNFPDNRTAIRAYDLQRELIDKFYEDARKTSPKSAEFISAIEDPDIKAHALGEIACDGRLETAIIAVDMIMQIDNSWCEAQRLSHVIQFTNHDDVKNKAYKALSDSVDKYASAKDQQTRFYALGEVAGHGLLSAAETAYNVINESEFSVMKIRTLYDIAMHGKVPEIRKKAVNTISEHVDEYASIKDISARASVLEYVAICATDEAVERAYSSILRIRKPKIRERALKFVGEVGKLCVRKKATEYLEKNKKNIGEKLASVF